MLPKIYLKLVLVKVFKAIIPYNIIMPKTKINYENTIIYKIVCNDLNIKDLYVGHTTDFIRRKYDHKKRCCHFIYNEYYSKVYTFIRNNGGWTNWSMIEIEKISCKDRNDATKRERYWLEELSAKLNTVIPNAINLHSNITLNIEVSPNVDKFIKEHLIKTDSNDDYVQYKVLYKIFSRNKEFKSIKSKIIQEQLINKMNNYKLKTKLKVNGEWIDFRSVFIGWKLKEI